MIITNVVVPVTATQIEMIPTVRDVIVPVLIFGGVIVATSAFLVKENCKANNVICGNFYL